MQGWARLDAAQRQRFFEAFVKAALRLDRLELRVASAAAPISAARRDRSGRLCNF